MWDSVFFCFDFRLKDGEMSGTIKTKFGYHLILMVERTGDDAIVRHILRMPPVTDAEINQAKARLDTVRSKVVAGILGFNEAATKYSDDESAKYTGPCVLNRDGSPYINID